MFILNQSKVTSFLWEVVRAFRKGCFSDKAVHGLLFNSFSKMLKFRNVFILWSAPAYRNAEGYKNNYTTNRGVVFFTIERIQALATKFQATLVSKRPLNIHSICETEQERKFDYFTAKKIFDFLCYSIASDFWADLSLKKQQTLHLLILTKAARLYNKQLYYESPLRDQVQTKY